MRNFYLALVLLPAAIAFYAYVGYPLILWMMRKRNGMPGDSADAGNNMNSRPRVSVVMTAYNEQAQIAGAIEALLVQDYPRDRMQIVVVSDASTDDTDEIVSRYASRGVELVRMPQRSGKTGAENFVSARLSGEIVVNSDSSVRLHPSAVSALVAGMADPDVGVASSRDVSIAASTNSTNRTEAGYVGYEMWVRDLETRSGGIVGASGSCYAIRAELHRIPVRDDLSRDFSAALTARRHGFRAVSVDEAVCYVPRTHSMKGEFHRKVRTISHGMNTLYANRRLLDPRAHGIFAWKLFSHKVCRWLVPIGILPAAIGLVLLSFNNVFALVLLLAASAILLIGLAGLIWPAERAVPPGFSTLAFGILANLSVFYALWRFISRRNEAVWEPTRRRAAAR